MKLETTLSSVMLIAKEVGERIVEIYQNGHFNQNIKDDSTPVTSADMEAHQLICEKLFALTPDIPVLSEEDANIPLSTRQTWSRYWLVDPLDGTQEFISGTGEFTVTIALIEHNLPIMGVVYYPLKHTHYYAIKSLGAWKKTGSNQPQQIHINKRVKNDNSLKVTISHRQSQTKALDYFSSNWRCDFIHLGSASLKSCLVAEGGADCYLRLGVTGEWDTAAVQCIIEEAGGSILDLNWQPLSYNMRETLKNPSFIAIGDKNLVWSDIIRA